MKWLVDTNVVSEVIKTRPNARVRDWLDAQNPFDSTVSVMTVFEIEMGIARKERSDPRQGAALRRWADHLFSEEFRGRILSITDEIARIAAGMHLPDPRPDRDAFIAATARKHNLTVVTRNVSDFAPLGARVLDPWNT